MPPPTTAIDAKPAPCPSARTRVGARPGPREDTRQARGRRLTARRIKDETRRMPPCDPARDYVELRCRSAFSFLEAASNPEDLVDARRRARPRRPRARRSRRPLRRCPASTRRAKAAGLRARSWAPTSRSSPRPRRPRQAPCCCSSRSPRGYRNLCRLLTRRARALRQGRIPRATGRTLEAHADGLVALLRGDAALGARAARRARGSASAPAASASTCRGICDAAPRRAARRAAALAEAAGVPLVATGDVRHARAADRPLFDALTCLRDEDHARRAPAAGSRRNAERHLHAPREMAARFADRPAWLAHHARDRRALRVHARRSRLPLPRASRRRAARRRSDAAAPAHLRRARASATAIPSRRARAASSSTSSRVIAKLDLAGYFLIVWDIARFAASAASSRRGAARRPTARSATRSASPPSIRRHGAALRALPLGGARRVARHRHRSARRATSARR